MTGTRWASLLAKEVAGLRSAEHLPGFTYYEEAYPDWSAFTDYGDRWVEVRVGQRPTVHRPALQRGDNLHSISFELKGEERTYMDAWRGAVRSPG